MMKREKFLADAKADPARFYRTPNDVLRDRRLSDADRREILEEWERKLGADGAEELTFSIRRALQELQDDGQDGRGVRQNRGS